MRNWSCKTPTKYVFTNMLVEFLFTKQIFETKTKKNYFNMASLFGSIAHQTNVLFHSYEYTAAFWKGYQAVKDHISLAQKLGKCCVTAIPLHFPGKTAKLIMQHVCFQYNYVCIFFWNTTSPWFGTELLVGPLLKFPIYLLICIPLTLSHRNTEHPHSTGFCKKLSSI